MSARDPIRSVAILGAGLVGLSAAVAFVRALPGLTVTLIDIPADPAALADRLPGNLPSIAAFHDRIGLPESDLFKAGATHRIGTRLSGWTAQGGDFWRIHGDHGVSIAPGGFHQHWLNAHRAGPVPAYDAFSPAAALGAAERFVPPVDDPASLLSGFDYALRLDPPRYTDLLRAYATHLGITRLSGSFAGIERRADGGVATLRLTDGRRIDSDLYVDAAGPVAPLRNLLGEEDREDWSAFLPVDRLLLGTAPPVPPTPTDRLTALPAGWRFTAPLRDRALTGLAYASRHSSDATARRILPAGTEVVPLRPGARRDPWRHNVLALGDAAVTLDPLADANLHLAQSAIARALDLLPGRDCAAVELAEYNRRSLAQAMRVRDFQAAHYLPTGRTQGDFWRSAARLAKPDTLAHTLDQFARRGRLPHHEEESFDRAAWTALLLNLGLIPRIADPVASAMPPPARTAALARLADAVAALPARLPPYPAWLAQQTGRR